MNGAGLPSPLAVRVYTCRALGCGASEPGRPHEPPGWGYSVDGSHRCPVHASAEREALYRKVRGDYDGAAKRLTRAG